MEHFGTVPETRRRLPMLSTLGGSIETVQVACNSRFVSSSSADVRKRDSGPTSPLSLGSFAPTKESEDLSLTGHLDVSSKSEHVAVPRIPMN